MTPRLQNSRLPTDLQSHRLTALRARYLVKLLDLGYNVLALDPTTHFARDPYAHLKAAPRYVRLFMATDSCSLSDASVCCNGALFPCTHDGIMYAQQVRGLGRCTETRDG